MSSTLVILNPAAHSERAQRKQARVESLARDCVVCATTYVGEAESMARRAVEEGFQKIVAAGGDGTINEVVNGLAGTQVASFEKIARGIYQLYIDNDASLVEVNPLIVTKDGAVMALDAKINIDANAVFRQPAMAKYRDPSQEDPREREASEHDLNYVSLDGDIA